MEQLGHSFSDGSPRHPCNIRSRANETAAMDEKPPRRVALYVFVSDKPYHNSARSSDSAHGPTTVAILDTNELKGNDQASIATRCEERVQTLSHTTSAQPLDRGSTVESKPSRSTWHLLRIVPHDECQNMLSVSGLPSRPKSYQSVIENFHPKCDILAN